MFVALEDSAIVAVVTIDDAPGLVDRLGTNEQVQPNYVLTKWVHALSTAHAPRLANAGRQFTMLEHPHTQHNSDAAAGLLSSNESAPSAGSAPCIYTGLILCLSFLPSSSHPSAVAPRTAPPRLSTTINLHPSRPLLPKSPCRDIRPSLTVRSPPPL